MCVRKPNGKMRLCLDLTQLKKFIICLQHDSKLVEDLLPKLWGAKVFSILDACPQCLLPCIVDSDMFMI